MQRLRAHMVSFSMLLLCLSPLFGQGIGPDAKGKLPTVSQPPWPKEIPGYTQLDPETGLHMTGTPQRIDITAYRLKVSGNVTQPLSLSFDDIRRMPRVSSRPVLTCEGYFEDTATWAGASLAALLDRAGIRASAREVDLVSADGYRTSFSIAQAKSPDAYLAYELEGKAIPVLHGFPLRAVMPGLTGFYWAKWIVAIEVE